MPFTADHCARARRDFPALDRRRAGQPLAYLDGPAGTQVPRAVIDAVSDYYRTHNANSGGRFETSRETDRTIRRCRETVAAFLGAPAPATISFGANMTTLAFQLAHAVARCVEPGDEVVVTELDHEANREPWMRLAERGAVVRQVRLRPDGRLDAGDLEAKIGERTRLVAIGLASNSLGTVNDVPRARELARRAGALLVVDAVHYAPHLPLDVASLDPDFLLCSAYKFYGPHVGILYSRPGRLDELPTDRLRPQEAAAPWRIETGTLDHAALAGVTAAIEYLASWGEGEGLRTRIVDAMRAIGEWELDLARAYRDGLAAIPGARLYGPGLDEPERAPTLSITLEGEAPAAVAERLGEDGVLTWHGDFYATRAVEALGLAERGGLLRVGFSLYNTPREVERLLAGIARR